MNYAASMPMFPMGFNPMMQFNGINNVTPPMNPYGNFFLNQSNGGNFENLNSGYQGLQNNIDPINNEFQNFIESLNYLKPCEQRINEDFQNFSNKPNIQNNSLNQNMYKESPNQNFYNNFNFNNNFLFNNFPNINMDEFQNFISNMSNAGNFFDQGNLGLNQMNLIPVPDLSNNRNISNEIPEIAKGEGVITNFEANNFQQNNTNQTNFKTIKNEEPITEKNNTNTNNKDGVTEKEKPEENSQIRTQSED